MKKTIYKMLQSIIGLLKPITNNQRGVVLPVILMAIGGLSLIGAAAVSVSTGEMNIAHNDRSYKIALNMAEAGIQDAADGIAGNRYILPSPLGSVQNASYTFNTALNANGRYIVTIEIPSMTTVAQDTAAGSTQMTVTNATGLYAGASIIIGNSSIQMASKIGTINGNVITLVDDRNQPSPLKSIATAGMYVALNKVRVTSTGQAGVGLVGQNPLTSWRNIAALNATPNNPVSTAGSIRSAVTLRAEYSIQELEIFQSFNAQVWTSGNKFNGPMLITNNLTVSPYAKGDFTGPIFKTTTANVAFYPSSTSMVPMVYPDIPKIITIPVSNVNVNSIIANAASNAACYQQTCNGPNSTSQLYYVNGYQIDVYDAAGLTKAPSDATSTDIIMTEMSHQYTESLTQVITLTFNVGPNVANNTTFNIFFDNTQGGSGNQLTPTAVVPLPNGVSVGGGPSGKDITVGAAARNSTFQVTTTLSTLASNKQPTAGGTYYVLAKPGGQNFYNYMYLTFGPLNLTSQVRQGNLVMGNHTGHDTPNATTPPPALATPEVKGKYLDGAGAPLSTNTWKAVPNGNAVLFDSQIINTMTTGNTKLTPGTRCYYDTTFYIHTNEIGSCSPEDMKVVSRTMVTFIGTRKNPCNINEQLLLFSYETIWNHYDQDGYGPLANGKKNGLNIGLQPNDADPGVAGIPRKGYYKWVQSFNVNTAGYVKPRILMGDREYNSLFNHASFAKFTGAVVNWNIRELRMVGWSNPPTVFYAPNGTPNGKTPVANSTMKIMPKVFPTTNWTDSMASVPELDNDDLSREYSTFSNAIDTNGFDYVGIGVTTFDYNGNRYLIDSSTLQPPTNSVALYSTSTANTDPLAAAIWGPSATLSIGAESPFLPNKAQAPITRITGTNSGPYTDVSVKRGVSNLFFDPANGITFNTQSVGIETKSTGYSQIIIGSTANPALLYTGTFSVSTDSCTQDTIDFTFVGKLIALNVNLQNNVEFDINTSLTTNGGCLNPQSGSYIYLKKQGWQEIRN